MRSPREEMGRGSGSAFDPCGTLYLLAAFGAIFQEEARRMKPSSEIPRPAGSLVANSLWFAKNTMQFYEDAFRECGDIFATRIPGLGNWVYICSPELVRTLLAAPSEALGGDLGAFSLVHVLGSGA